MIDFVAFTRGDGRCPSCGMKLERMEVGAINAEQRRRMGLTTVRVAEGYARMSVRAYGAARFDERRATAVVARIAGRVVRRHEAALHHGTRVQEGDALLDLYSPMSLAAQGEMQAALAAGDQALVEAVTQRFARWNLAEVAERIRAGGAPTDTVTIRSPAAGIVIEGAGMDGKARELPRVGQELMGDEVLFSVVDPGSFIVAVHVPEAQSRFLRLGQPVHIASDDAGELPGVKATISWMAPELNAEIRAREIHLHLADPAGRLIAGALVSARVEAVLGPDLGPADPADPATWGRFVLVPRRAVLSTGVRHVAWRVAGEDHGAQRFEPVALLLGPRLEDLGGEDRYVVRAGLAAGDQVAAEGAFLIDSQAQLAGSPSLLFPDGAVAPAAGHQHGP